MNKNLKRLVTTIMMLIILSTMLPTSVFATQSRTQNFNKSYILTGNGANDICSVALAQYEKTGSQLGYTEDWCANFVSDCAKLAGLSSVIPAHGGVSSLYSNIINAGGKVVSSPRVGDIAFIDWNKRGGYGHAEIVYQVSGNTVYSIGGNSGPDTSSLYKAQVWKHTLSLSSGYFTKFVRPKYPTAPTLSEPTISGYNKPNVLTVGNVFSISGAINSGKTITSVTVGCYDVDGKKQISASGKPNATSYDIKKLDDALLFNILKPGVYRYKITAATSSGTTVLVDEPFTVLAKSETVPSGTYVMMPYENITYAVGIEEASNAEGANIELQTRQNSKHQTVSIKHVGNGYYNIQFIGSEKNMAVVSGGTKDAANICQYGVNNTDNQKFQILPAGNSFCIVPKSDTQLCLTVTNASFTAGANIQASKRALSKAQCFVFEEADADFDEEPEEKPEETPEEKPQEKPEETPQENPFVDVLEEKFYYDAVLWAYENGITSGIDATHFEPDGNCTRAQVVAFLWRTQGKPMPKTTENPFVDVPEEKFYYDAVLWAYENGITAGADATHFNPDGTCTRGQFVTFLWRAQGKSKVETTKNPFVDVPKEKFYYDAVLWAYENGITAGANATHFEPNGNCKRGQVVTFLYRMQE